MSFSAGRKGPPQICLFSWFVGVSTITCQDQCIGCYALWRLKEMDDGDLEAARLREALGQEPTQKRMGS